MCLVFNLPDRGEPSLVKDMSECKLLLEDGKQGLDRKITGSLSHFPQTSKRGLSMWTISQSVDEELPQWRICSSLWTWVGLILIVGYDLKARISEGSLSEWITHMFNKEID